MAIFPKILSKQHATIVFMRKREETALESAQKSGSEALGGGRAMVRKLVPILVDMGSTNGTLVNGEKVIKRKPNLLRNGTVVAFGGKKSDLIFRVEITERVRKKDPELKRSKHQRKKRRRKRRGRKQ